MKNNFSVNCGLREEENEITLKQSESNVNNNKSKKNRPKLNDSDR